MLSTLRTPWYRRTRPKQSCNGFEYGDFSSPDVALIWLCGNISWMQNQAMINALWRYWIEFLSPTFPIGNETTLKHRDIWYKNKFDVQTWLSYIVLEKTFCNQGWLLVSEGRRRWLVETNFEFDGPDIFLRREKTFTVPSCVPFPAILDDRAFFSQKQPRDGFGTVYENMTFFSVATLPSFLCVRISKAQ